MMHETRIIACIVNVMDCKRASGMRDMVPPSGQSAPRAQFAKPAPDDAASVYERPVLAGDQAAAHAEGHRNELAPEGAKLQQACAVQSAIRHPFTARQSKRFATCSPRPGQQQMQRAWDAASAR